MKTTLSTYFCVILLLVSTISMTNCSSPVENEAVDLYGIMLDHEVDYNDCIAGI